jgi:hypothetical protein
MAASLSRALLHAAWGVRWMRETYGGHLASGDVSTDLNPATSSLITLTWADSALRAHAVRSSVLAAHDCEFATDNRARV